MVTDCVTILVAGAAFAVLYGAAGKRLDQSGPGRTLDVPGIALAVLICGWLVVSSICESAIGRAGTEPAHPSTLATLASLLRDAVLLLWSLAVLGTWQGVDSLHRLFPRRARQLLLQTALAVLGYLPVRVTVLATYNCTLYLATQVGYTGPISHPTLQVIAEASALERWLLIASVTLVTPLLEEAMFRVALVGWLKRHISLAAAVLVSAVIFALFHWPPVTQPAMLAMGIMMAWAYVRTGSLYVPALMHALFNLHSVIDVLMS